VAFPDDPLAIAVEVALDADLTKHPGAWAWTDATALGLVRARDKVVITQGRQDTYSQVPPSQCRLTVDNTGGRWVARNPTGPWYGLIRRNTPIRVLVEDWDTEVSDAFGRTVTDGWGAADTGQAWSNAGFGGTVANSDFAVASGVGTHSVPVAAAYRRTYLADVETVDQDVTVSVTCPQATGANLEPANIYLRATSSSVNYLCRVQVTTGNAVQVVIIRNDASGATTLVSATTVSGLTHSAGTALKVRAMCNGTTVRMRVWQGTVEPEAWHAEVVDTAPLDAPGWVSVRSGVASGNTNTKPVVFSYDNFSVTRPPARFEGFIDELPVRWDPSGADRYVPITASGVLRRILQGDAPLRSALVRALTSADYPQPVAYWPCEDEAGSTTLASALPGGQAATYTALTLGSYTGIPGSASLPVTDVNAFIYGAVPTFAATPTQWAVRFVAYIPSAPASEVFPFGCYTTGTLTWGVGVTAGGNIRLTARDSTWTEVLGDPGASLATFFGRPVYIMLNITQSGADIAWLLETVDVMSLAYTYTSGIEPGQTCGQPTRMQASLPYAGWSVGHYAIYDDTDAGPPTAAARGWSGTTAIARVNGLCHEANIISYVTEGTPATYMGAASTAGTPQLLYDTEAADIGILYERGYGLGYLARWQRYNRDVDLTIDHAADQLDDLQPTDDDQATRNDVEVSRTGGSKYRHTDDAHVALYGRYDDAVTINVEADTDLPYQAQMRVALGTIDDLRYPVVGLNLMAAPELVTDWKQCRVGSRVQVVNPPDELPPDTIDVHLEGWTETLDAFTWLVEANTSPARPWQVFELEDDTLGRLDTEGTYLLAALTATATTALLATETGPQWSTTAEPYDLHIAGERVTVTTMNTNPGSLVNAGTAAHADNAAVNPGMPPSVAAGDCLLVWAASRNTAATLAISDAGYDPLLVDGNIAVWAKTHTGTETAPTVTPSGGSAGDTVSAQMAALRYVQPVAVYTAVQTNGSAQDIAVPAALPDRANTVILWLGQKADDWTSVATLAAADGEIGEPDSTTGSDQGIVWDYAVQTTPAEVAATSFVVTGGAAAVSKGAVVILKGDVQSATVTRSVNGVAKAQAAGAAVSLWRPGQGGLAL